MKKVLFISSNKMLGQGMSAAFQSKPEQVAKPRLVFLSAVAEGGLLLRAFSCLRGYKNSHLFCKRWE